MEKTTLIQTNNLTKQFKTKKQTINALKKIDLKVQKGELVTIIGRSGSGKTTLLNMLGALDTPTSGQVIFEGKNLQNQSKNQLALLRRYKISFIFQTFNLLPTLTVRENIELSLIHHKHPKTLIQQKILNLLEYLQITDKIESFPNELSVGQQQKVAIARALIKDPLLILADEPTGEMDPIATKEILQKLILLNQKSNTTLIIASHNNLLSNIGHKTIFLKDGNAVTQKKAGY